MSLCSFALRSISLSCRLSLPVLALPSSRLPLPPRPLHPVPPAPLGHIKRCIGLGGRFSRLLLVSGHAATPNEAVSGQVVPASPTVWC